MVRVTFIHPDLGIGGAERLVVDAALALQIRNCKVNFVTNHHDVDHCFPETKELPVTVIGDWIPRSIFGRCHALCAYIRMLYLTLYFLLFIAPKSKPDIFICDQIPVSIPFLKLFRYPVLFYCHFPDQLLSTPEGELKELYRRPINWIEEACLNFADRIVVNSLFTLNIFQTTFQKITQEPGILYPSINTGNFDEIGQQMNVTLKDILPDLPDDTIVFLSINRFERKKNLGLAIRALQALETIISDAQYNKVHLVMMGGYDVNVEENISYFKELLELCEYEGLDSKVTFFQSPTEEQKIALLRGCNCVIYTPENEHFGIVPLEAMYARKPVIAVKSGGPTETIKHETTGYLSDPVPEYFAFYMGKIVTDAQLSKRMGEAGRQRFELQFSFEAFTVNLSLIINELLDSDNGRIR